MMHRSAARNNIRALERTWKKETRARTRSADGETDDVVNQLDSGGCTPLFRAASAGHVEAIRWLLDHGADPTIAVPLTADTSAGDMAPGAVPFSDPAPGRTPAHAAAAFTHASTAAETPITALMGHAKALQLVTAADADGATPLHVAALCGNEVNVELLLSETLLMAVSSTVGMPGEAVRIYDSFVDATDTQGRTALVYACCWYQGRDGQSAPLPVIGRLLGGGANVHAKDTPGGMTVLHHASRAAPLDVVQTIVAATCSGDAVGAAATRQVRSVENNNEATSMQKARLVNTKADSDGTTALMAAISAKRYETVRFLLEEGGADPNIPAENGFTALHQATNLYEPRISKTVHGDIESVRLLLDAGADPDVRDADGKLPIDYARNNRAVERAIESHSRQLLKRMLDKFQESDVVKTEKTLMQLESLQDLGSALLTEEQATLVRSLAEHGIDPELLKRTQDMLPRMQLMEERLFSDNTDELSRLGEEFRQLKEQLGDLTDVPELGQFYAEFEELCQLREEFDSYKNQAAELQDRLLHAGNASLLSAGGSADATSRDHDMQLLMQDEKRLTYYNVLRGDLCAAHLAASCAKSGMIEGKRKGGFGRAGDMLSAFGSAVPIAGPGLQVLGSILRLVDKVNQEKVLGRIAELAVDAVEASELAELVARKLALWERPEDGEEGDGAGGGGGSASEDVAELSDKKSASRASRVAERLSSFMTNINRTTSAIAGGDMSWFFGALEGSAANAHQHYSSTDVEKDDEDDAEVVASRARQSVAGRGNGSGDDAEGGGTAEAKSGRRTDNSRQKEEKGACGTESKQQEEDSKGRIRGFFRNTKELLFKDKAPETVPPEASFASEDAKLIIAAIADGLLRTGDQAGGEEKEGSNRGGGGGGGGLPIMKSVVERATILIHVLNPDFTDTELATELKVSYRSIRAARAAAGARGDPNALFEADDGSGSLGYCMGDMALLPEWKRCVMDMRQKAIAMVSPNTLLSSSDVSAIAAAIMSRTAGHHMVVTVAAPVLDFHSLSTDGAVLIEAKIQDARVTATAQAGLRVAARRNSLRGSLSRAASSSSLGAGAAAAADPHAWFACLVSMAKQADAPPHSGDLWGLVVAHFAEGSRSRARVILPVHEDSAYRSTVQALQDCVVQALGVAPANVTIEFAPSEDDDIWSAQQSALLSLSALELYQSMLRERYESLLSAVNQAAAAAATDKQNHAAGAGTDDGAGAAEDAAVAESLACVSWGALPVDSERLTEKRREFASIAHGYALSQEYEGFVAQVTEDTRRSVTAAKVELESAHQTRDQLRERILQLERELDGSTTQLERVQTATEAVSEEIRQQLGQMRAVHAAREADTASRIEALEASLKSRGEEIVSLQLSVTAADAGKGEAEEKAATLESSVSRLEGECSDMRQQVSVSETRIQQLEVSAAGARTLQESTEGQRKQLESSLQTSTARVGTLEAQLAEVRSGLNETAQRLAAAEAENAALRRTHEHDEQEHQRFEDKLSTRDAHIASLEEQLEAVKHESASRAATIAQLQREAVRAAEVREAMERKTARLLGALEQAAEATALIQAEELGASRPSPSDAPNSSSSSIDTVSETDTSGEGVARSGAKKSVVQPSRSITVASTEEGQI